MSPNCMRGSPNSPLVSRRRPHGEEAMTAVGWLDGRVAVVTGAGTGIGAAVAARFAAEGARVILVGRRPEPLRAVAAALGEQALAAPADAASAADMAQLAEMAVARFGGIDVLVANAGGHGVGTAESIA